MLIFWFIAPDWLHSWVQGLETHRNCKLSHLYITLDQYWSWLYNLIYALSQLKNAWSLMHRYLSAVEWTFSVKIRIQFIKGRISTKNLKSMGIRLETSLKKSYNYTSTEVSNKCKEPNKSSKPIFALDEINLQIFSLWQCNKHIVI